MSAATDNPDLRWEAFAAREPYFAVLTAPQFLRANLTPDSEREFFASGEQYVEWLLRLIGERLVPEFAPVSTLEFGCGVGRLAIPFAKRAGRVTAVDRSPAVNHSATALVAAGNPPPSPIPSRKRQTSSDRNPVASPCEAVASDHAIMIASRPRLVPSASTSAPPPAYISA